MTQIYYSAAHLLRDKGLLDEEGYIILDLGSGSVSREKFDDYGRPVHTIKTTRLGDNERFYEYLDNSDALSVSVCYETDSNGFEAWGFGLFGGDIIFKLRCEDDIYYLNMQPVIKPEEVSN